MTDKKGRKDARNREKESGNWKPGKWTPGKVSRFMLHVQKVALDACESILGPHDGRTVGAKIVAEGKEQKSVAVLRSMCVKLIGDEAKEGGCCGPYGKHYD